MEKLRGFDLSNEPLLGRILESKLAAAVLTIILAASSFDSCMEQVSQGTEFPVDIPLGLNGQYQGAAGGGLQLPDSLPPYVSNNPGMSREILFPDINSIGLSQKTEIQP